MAATPSTFHETPNLIDRLENRLEDMERLAESGEWEKIEGLLHRLPQLIARIPVSERRPVLLVARASVERLRERAVQQSHEVSTRLATIRTGRQATESYRVTGAMTSDTRL